MTQGTSLPAAVPGTAMSPPRGRTARSRAYSGAMSNQTFHATGLTCGHCSSAVQEELTALDGVDSAEVTVVKDGVSTIDVTSDRDLDRDEVAAALDEAGGYQLVTGPGA